KGGVDDLPDQPLIGLYKTQVRQMAGYLGVPQHVQKQAPSADMVRGVSDEYAIGMRYSTLDLGLDYLARGVSLEDLLSAGITDKDVQRIREMKVLSQWKRQDSIAPPAIDGSIHGGLRVGY
ncbi:MAG: NAD(+) synthase, partial [Anaerolineaceae bacterium]